MVRSYTSWMARHGHLSLPEDRAMRAIDGGCVTNALLPNRSDPMPRPLSLEDVV